MLSFLDFTKLITNFLAQIEMANHLDMTPRKSIQGTRIDPDGFSIIYELLDQKRAFVRKSREIIELYNFCETTDQRDLVLDLLRRFKIVDSEELDSLGENLAKNLTGNWKLNADNTLFIPTGEDNVDSSQAILQAIKNKFADYGWNSTNFSGSIGKGAHAIKDNQTAILFDDFIGSGTTILRRYDWFMKRTEAPKRNIQVKIVALACMESTFYHIYAESQIPIYAELKLKRGISEHYKNHEVLQKKNEMLKLEEKLTDAYKNNLRKQYSLGFDESESIYTLHGYNISDNVFPVFWWPYAKPNTKRNTIFSRLI